MASLISIQMNSGNDVAENINTASNIVAQACSVSKGDKIVVLPECFSLFGVSGSKALGSAEIIDQGWVQKQLSDIASLNACYLVCGTMPIVSHKQDQKYFAASIVFDPSGVRVSHYNKMHLFDVDVADATSAYRESKYTHSGKHVSLFTTPMGEVGQTVCYDLRFPALFNAFAEHTANKQSPNIIVVPSAFTKLTGKAHWHALLKARSIENQCFVVASNQTGIHSDGRETFGNSCIYSPWGECLSLIEEGEGYAMADFDLKSLQRIRMNMPVHAHKKERYQIES